MFRVTYGKDVELVVRRGTVEDDLHAQLIRGMLVEVAEGETGFWNTFPRLCSQTHKAKGLSFCPVDLHKADAKTVLAAYEGYLKLDKELARRWSVAVDKADAPVDADLGPEPLPADAEKKE